MGGVSLIRAIYHSVVFDVSVTDRCNIDTSMDSCSGRTGISAVKRVEKSRSRVRVVAMAMAMVNNVGASGKSRSALSHTPRVSEQCSTLTNDLPSIALPDSLLFAVAKERDIA